jgi:hypothetical protein
MALFSDIDWVILVAVAAFLLFGKGNTQILRTMGRYYGRAARLKQELLSEFTRAADLPPPGTPGQVTFRGALLGLDPPVSHVSGIPAAVTAPPVVAVVPPPPATPVPWTGGLTTPTWSMTVPASADPTEVAR